MRRPSLKRALLAIIIIGFLAFAGHWLWTTPLAPIRSQATIGKLNLQEPGAKLLVRFAPLESMSSITLRLAKPIKGSGEFSAPPDFPLSVHVRAREVGGTNVIDAVITRDRMQWTSWHDSPSLLLLLDGWLGHHLRPDHEYDLSLTVDSAIADLGEADVFLHWMDRGYVWGRVEQKLQLTSPSSDPPPQ